MSKKDYQAIAGALYAVRPTCNDQGPHDCDTPVSREQWNFDVRAVMGVMAQDSPRFDCARFVEACETGRCKGMRAAS